MIGIVTVLYNSAPVLEEFFLSLEKQTFKNFKLYVVDNNSSDNSVEVCKTLMEKVSFHTELFEEKTNWGVAKGNNIGISKSLEDGCDYVLLSNNDIIFDKDTITTLYDAMDEEDATIVVPKFYFYGMDKMLWCAGGYFNWKRGACMHYGDKEIDRGQYDERKNITYCPTCFMLIQSEVFARIGIMDEKYFVYCDDSDFCWRATIMGKEKMSYIPEAVIYHKESFSTGGVKSDFGIHFIRRNNVYFALKNFQFCYRIYYFFYLFVIHFFLKDLWSMPLKQQKLMFKSYIEGFRLFYKK